LTYVNGFLATIDPSDLFHYDANHLSFRQNRTSRVQTESATVASSTYKITDFSLFSGLGPEDAERIQGSSMMRHFPANARIFDEGERALGLYLVLTGSVKIFKVSPRGHEQVLAVLGPGQTFAEAPVFQGGGYPASSQSLEESELIFVEREALLKLLRSDPEMALRMMAGMAFKLRRLVSLVEDLTLRDARGRLCRYLVGLAEEGVDYVQLPVQQTLLSRMLGLTSETLSRTLKNLRDDEIIDSSRGGRIEVCNWELLRQEAGEGPHC
jgi:CRP-like cAMP-binding protein